MSDCKSPCSDYYVFHLIHKEKIGGVEVAVKRSHACINEKINYRVYSIMSFQSGEYSYSMFQFFLDLIKYKRKILISSLWYSHLIAFIFSIFSDSWIAFFHSAAVFHRKDRFGKAIAIWFADGFFCDSEATAKFHKLKNFSLIPYVFGSAITTEGRRDIDFIFVARADPVKRVDLFIDLINSLRKEDSSLTAQIYTDDNIDTLLRADQINSLDGYEVFIDASQSNICRAMLRSKFFVSTSEKEGFGSAVAEAINSGCVPVLTMVGEPINYLDDQTAVYLRSSNGFGKDEIAKITLLLKDTRLRTQMSGEAIKRLSTYGNYTDKMVLNIRRHIIQTML